MFAMKDEARERVSADGTVVVVVEVRERGLERGGCGLMKVKHRQDVADRTAEEEPGIAAGREIEDAAETISSLVERGSSWHARHSRSAYHRLESRRA
jgi:hypothetical protein